MNQVKDCCVCFENFEINNGPELPCSHNVCQECYDRLRRNNCPLCRTPFRIVNPNQIFESDEHRQLIEDYQNDYEHECLMDYPEFSQKKIHLDEVLLTELPTKELRTREQVIDWMVRNLTYDQLCYTGW